ncbi:MAG: hypothetical protein IT307_18655 [Chloroflexi bacterium]|nr:hypothetical protein [Chloroflexota bacterium]
MRHLHQLSRWLFLTLAAGLAVPLLAPTPALAHERRDVGPYQLVVGFTGEPAIQGQPNGIDLRITDRATQQPVEGAEKSLKATIAFGGGQAKEFPLRAVFQKPGAYTADLIPTRAGAYVFTFAGTINGQQVNEKFESGPGRFNDVQAASSLQFPTAEPAAADLQRSLDEARQQAQTANTLAVAGLVVGVLSLALAGFLLATRRSAAQQSRAVAPSRGRAD